MEWSLHIAGLKDLDYEIPPELARIFGPAQFTRIAYGTEFCEHLLPTAEALKAIIAASIPLTFLTPYVSDEGIVRLRRLFPLLSDSEVVFNDWGVLRLLRTEFPRLTPVQGRLLNKSLRDPRIMPVYAETSASEHLSALRVLQSSNLDNATYLALLDRHGVHSVELDNLPQGNDLGFASLGVRVSVYLPFGFISTGRVCMAAGLHYPPREKFQPAAPCRYECQTHQLEYTYTNSPFGKRGQKFWLKGNTYFYRHTPAMLESLAQEASRGHIARMVYQPRLPMFYR